MFKRYLILLFGISAAISLLVFLVIRQVDPYGTVRSERVAGLNMVKPASYRHKEAAKRSRFLRSDADLLLLGNSRVDVGFDSHSPRWSVSGFKPFNFGIPGQDYAGNFNQYYFALASGKAPRRVIVGLDFIDFINPAIRRTPDVGDAHIHPAVAGSFSLVALIDSVKTIAAQHSAGADDMTELGYNTLASYRAIIAGEGHDSVARQRNRANLQTYTKLKTIRAAAPAPDFFDMAPLRNFLERAAREKTDVTLFFHPYHLDLLASLDKAALTDLFKAWKLAVRKTMNKSGTDARLYDFATLNIVTSEPIPGPGDTKSHMQYYWEPGHYKSALGELMICIMLQDDCPLNIAADPLDTKLDFTGVEPSLRSQSKERLGPSRPAIDRPAS